jgi:hypothetical protein
MTELNLDGRVYTELDDPVELLALLRRHLDQTLDDSIYLSSDQLLTLKGWLVHKAENMQPGKAVWLEESVGDGPGKVVAALGKTGAGAAVVWHVPLPWPFGEESTSV